MEIRIQHVLLASRAVFLTLLLIACEYSFAGEHLVATGDEDGLENKDDLAAVDLDTEFFELGFVMGLLSIDDFSTEAVFGIGAKFHATEDLFLQFAYGQAHASLSTYERSQGAWIDNADRDYAYYDLLVGYNVLPGEVFPLSSQGYLSSIYLVAGVGNTDFGNEESFTLVMGVGYRVGIDGGLVWNIDFKDHIYQSSLIRENETTHNIELSTGISFLF